MSVVRRLLAGKIEIYDKLRKSAKDIRFLLGVFNHRANPLPVDEQLSMYTICSVIDERRVIFEFNANSKASPWMRAMGKDLLCLLEYDDDDCEMIDYVLSLCCTIIPMPNKVINADDEWSYLIEDVIWRSLESTTRDWIYAT